MEAPPCPALRRCAGRSGSARVDPRTAVHNRLVPVASGAAGFPQNLVIQQTERKQAKPNGVVKSAAVRHRVCALLGVDACAFW